MKRPREPSQHTSGGLRPRGLSSNASNATASTYAGGNGGGRPPPSSQPLHVHLQQKHLAAQFGNHTANSQQPFATHMPSSNSQQLQGPLVLQQRMDSGGSNPFSSTFPNTVGSDGTFDDTSTHDNSVPPAIRSSQTQSTAIAEHQLRGAPAPTSSIGHQSRNPYITAAGGSQSRAGNDNAMSLGAMLSSQHGHHSRSYAASETDVQRYRPRSMFNSQHPASLPLSSQATTTGFTAAGNLRTRTANFTADLRSHRAPSSKPATLPRNDEDGTSFEDTKDDIRAMIEDAMATLRANIKQDIGQIRQKCDAISSKFDKLVDSMADQNSNLGSSLHQLEEQHQGLLQKLDAMDNSVTAKLSSVMERTSSIAAQRPLPSPSASALLLQHASGQNPAPSVRTASPTPTMQASSAAQRGKPKLALVPLKSVPDAAGNAWDPDQQTTNQPQPKSATSHRDARQAGHHTTSAAHPAAAHKSHQHDHRQPQQYQPRGGASSSASDDSFDD